MMNKVAHRPIQTARVIGRFGDSDDAVLVLLGGIHGNEPSGVIAIQQVFAEITRRKLPVRGRLLGLAGNLAALASGQRQIDRNLNRIWNREFLDRFQAPVDSRDTSVSEYGEQYELYAEMEPLLRRQGYLPVNPDVTPRPAYFIDLHTTSAASEPFIAINDQLNNRDFSLAFPVPIVLGIEEYLAGPLLSFLNDFGPVAMAFEAGQHDDPVSVTRHTAFIWLALVQTGLLTPDEVPNWKQQRRILDDATELNGSIFEVFERRRVEPEDHFEMQPGFENFSPVKRGQLLAHDCRGSITAPHSARIFMPRYQAAGSDGFFLVRTVPGWALGLSRFLRRFRFQRWLLWLPGVSEAPGEEDALRVNKRMARFLTNQIFHLLGYRRKRDDGDEMLVSRREIR